MKTSLDKKPAWTLTAADLCDRCPARAVVVTAKLPGGSLLWCAHHFAFFEDALDAFGATILVYERDRQPSRRTPRAGNRSCDRSLEKAL